MQFESDVKSFKLVSMRHYIFMRVYVSEIVRVCFEKLQLEKLFTLRSTRWSEMLSKTQ